MHRTLIDAAVIDVAVTSITVINVTLIERNVDDMASNVAMIDV